MRKFLYFLIAFLTLSVPYNAAANDLASFAGTYKYIEEGADGELNLSLKKDTLILNVQTVSLASGHTCDYTGKCSMINGHLLCKEDEPDMSVEIVKVNNNTVQLNPTYELERMSCGQRMGFSGTYKK